MTICYMGITYLFWKRYIAASPIYMKSCGITMLHYMHYVVTVCITMHYGLSPCTLNLYRQV